MTRFILPSIFLLAACSQEVAAPDLVAGSYSGEGRSRLCIAGTGAVQRGGVIAYGASDTNCSVSGRIERADAGLVLVPTGDGDCRIPLSVNENEVRIAEVPASCSYYCGPDATLAGKVFSRDNAARPVTDLAGDPLC